MACACTVHCRPARTMWMPSTVSSAAAPGKEAANHWTSSPHCTKRRAISCVNSSAPPARGCRRSRQFSIRIRTRPPPDAPSPDALTGVDGRLAEREEPAGVPAAEAAVVDVGHVVPGVVHTGEADELQRCERGDDGRRVEDTVSVEFESLL